MREQDLVVTAFLEALTDPSRQPATIQAFLLLALLDVQFSARRQERSKRMSRQDGRHRWHYIKSIAAVPFGVLFACAHAFRRTGWTST